MTIITTLKHLVDKVENMHKDNEEFQQRNENCKGQMKYQK